MSQMFGVDLDQRRAERTYRTFTAEDDDFHDEELTDRWWETETMWFSWNIPERDLGGWAYCQARPNAESVQRRRLGVGRQRRLPLGAPVPGRVFGPAAATSTGT